MRFLDLTLPTPPENLALDEALLTGAESDGRAEYLRVWESTSYFVVLGKNCAVDEDVWVARCRADGVEILRRVSGGGTVLLGPGCLNFALVLRLDRAADLGDIPRSFGYVLDRVARSVSGPRGRAVRAGTSDLAVDDLKCCGNAQRRQRSHFLHHGSILYDFDLSRIARYLKEPQRQPAYRAGRDHLAFLCNAPAARAAIGRRLRSQWRAERMLLEWPRELVAQLARERYADPVWNLRR